MDLHDRPFEALLADIAARTPAPGGGAVASMTGATAAALARMVVAYSFGAKYDGHRKELDDADRRLDANRGLFLKLADDDARAYERVSKLTKVVKEDADRKRELDEAVEAATGFPLSAMSAACDLLRILEPLPSITNPQLRSDLGIAALLADAATRAAEWNVRVNLPAIDDRALARRIRDDADRLLTSSRTLAGAIESACSG